MKLEDKITNPCRIGATIFRPGIPVRMVISRAEREFEYHESGALKLCGVCNRKRWHTSEGNCVVCSGLLNDLNLNASKGE